MYDQVTEAQYASIVKDRLERDDFVEDDGVALRAGAEVERREVLGETELGRPARVGVRERKDLWRVVGKQLRMVM